jgi:ABC-type transport system involved in cytochrome bd biosynthesis fused ATPase/permease subunit
VASFAAFQQRLRERSRRRFSRRTARNNSMRWCRCSPAADTRGHRWSQHHRTDPARSAANAVRNLASAMPRMAMGARECRPRHSPGESVAIAGASGSGKSTLLRLLLGPQTPTRARLYYDGKNLRGARSAAGARQIGTVLESSACSRAACSTTLSGSAPLLSRDR